MRADTTHLYSKGQFSRSRHTRLSGPTRRSSYGNWTTLPGGLKMFKITGQKFSANSALSLLRIRGVKIIAQHQPLARAPLIGGCACSAARNFRADPRISASHRLVHARLKAGSRVFAQRPLRRSFRLQPKSQHRFPELARSKARVARLGSPLRGPSRVRHAPRSMRPVDLAPNDPAPRLWRRSRAFARGLGSSRLRREAIARKMTRLEVPGAWSASAHSRSLADCSGRLRALPPGLGHWRSVDCALTLAQPRSAPVPAVDWPRSTFDPSSRAELESRESPPRPSQCASTEEQREASADYAPENARGPRSCEHLAQAPGRVRR